MLMCCLRRSLPMTRPQQNFLSTTTFSYHCILPKYETYPFQEKFGSTHHSMAPPNESLCKSYAMANNDIFLQSFLKNPYLSFISLLSTMKRSHFFILTIFLT